MQNLITYLLVTFNCIKSGSISPYLVRMQENVDQNNSKYGHILRSVRDSWRVLPKSKSSHLTLFFFFVNISKEGEC